MNSSFLILLSLLSLTCAQAHGSPGNLPCPSYTSCPPTTPNPAPAPPANAPNTPALPAPTPLDPVYLDVSSSAKLAFTPVSVSTLATVSSGKPVPAPSANPTPTPVPSPSTPAIQPIIPMLRSALHKPLFSYTPSPSPNPTKEPTSFALSDISFASTLVPQVNSTSNPAVDDPEATPGDVRFCTSTTYKSESGDEEGAECDVVQSKWDVCRGLTEVFRKKSCLSRAVHGFLALCVELSSNAYQVLSVKPDKNQWCLFFAMGNCQGASEGIKWPGVQNSRGRVGEGGDWSRRIVSFRCMAEN